METPAALFPALGVLTAFFFVLFIGLELAGIGERYGRLIRLIGVAPLEPSEFVIFRIG